MRYLSERGLKGFVGGLPTTNGRVSLNELLACLKNISDVNIVRCKNCRHYPTNANSKPKSGFDIEWPKETDGWEDCTCPCYCSDPYYSYVPDPNGFCNKGETKE